MSVLDKILLEHKEKVLRSEEYVDTCEKIKIFQWETRDNVRINRNYRDGSARVDYSGPIGDYSRDDLRKLGIHPSFDIKNVVWVEEDYCIDGHFKGYRVQVGETEEYFSCQEDFFELIGRFPGHKVLGYSSDCGEEAINVIDNPHSWFSRD